MVLGDMPVVDDPATAALFDLQAEYRPIVLAVPLRLQSP